MEKARVLEDMKDGDRHVKQIFLRSLSYSCLLFSINRLKINIQNVYAISFEQHPKRGTILPQQSAASR